MFEIEQVRGYFDERADQWDAVCSHDRYKLAAVVTLARVTPGARVLDIACGTGVLFDELLSRNPASVLGVDLSPNMIAQARQKRRDPRLQTLAADLFDVEETGFDTAIIYSAYPHFPDKQRLAQKVRAMLAPGGRFLIAHSEGRQTINGRHGGSASPISTPLRPAREEAAAWEPSFQIDMVADPPDLYFIPGTADK